MVTGIETERPRLAKEWLFLPAFMLLAIILMAQRRRTAASPAGVASLGR